jgi:hypothetical protein
MIRCGKYRGQVGATAMMHGAATGHLDCVRLLIAGGANKEIIDKVCCGAHFKPLSSFNCAMFHA